MNPWLHGTYMKSCRPSLNCDYIPVARATPDFFPQGTPSFLALSEVGTANRRCIGVIPECEHPERTPRAKPASSA